MNIKSTTIFFISITFFAIISYKVFRNTLISHLIPPACGEGETCVRFCCVDVDCTNDTELRSMEMPNSEILGGNYTILKGLPCDDFHKPDNWTFMKVKMKFLTTVWVLLLWVLFQRGWLVDHNNYTYDWNDYCFEDGALTCIPINEIETIKTIFPWRKDHSSFKLNKFYFHHFSVMILSIPFLIATLVIYGLIKELRTLHGRCVMSYVLSLTLLYSLQATIGLYNHEMLDEFRITCKCFGYLSMAAILMCFFWLNVMCYDTWSTIRFEILFFCAMYFIIF
jgi:hypothetical protein